MPLIEESALFAAVKARDAGVVRRLLGEGHPVDTLGAGGQTALMWAARFDNTKLVHLLLGAGAAIDRTDDSGWTALAYAAVEEAAAAVDALLKAGASPNASNGRALFGALSRGRPSIVRRLVGAGADLSRRGWGERTPIEAAAHEGDRDLVAAVLAGKNPQRALDGALVEAAAGGHAVAVELLLAAGADPSFTSERGNSALGLARKRRRKEVVALLVAHGARVAETSTTKRRIPPPPELPRKKLDQAKAALATLLGATAAAKRRSAAKKIAATADPAFEGVVTQALARELGDVRPWEGQRELARTLGLLAGHAAVATWLERVLAEARFESTVVPEALADATVRIHARSADAKGGRAGLDRLLRLALSDRPTTAEGLAIVSGALTAACESALAASPAVARRVHAFVAAPGEVPGSQGAMLDHARKAWTAYSAEHTGRRRSTMPA